ncbi:MAG: G5 domain-containing protein [Firmicutes bacterium]|nr:G5 domain-containing protein [Bacillota bacterium]
MNYLKSKYNSRRTFIKVLSCAIAFNLLLVGALVFVEISVKDITVTVNGKTAQYKTTKQSVDKMLNGWQVDLDKKDVVDPGKKAKLEDGMDVNIKLFEVQKETVEEKTKFDTTESYTSEIMEGESRVVKKGKKGIDEVTYKVTYLGGEEQSRKEIARKTIKEPVTEEVELGTAVAYNGEKYSRVLTVVATGYTHTGHRTATGTYPHRGTMAVDRGVIAMGSYGYVPGYGAVHAEDTGGAIRGNRIDLFFETRGQAISWGRRTVLLYIK